MVGQTLLLLSKVNLFGCLGDGYASYIGSELNAQSMDYGSGYMPLVMDGSEFLKKMQQALIIGNMSVALMEVCGPQDGSSYPETIWCAVGTESEFISELFGLSTVFVSGDLGHGASGDVSGIPGTNGLPPDAFADARRVLVPLDTK